MVYTSRIVGVGVHNDIPFTMFTLASRSIPFRQLVVDDKKSKVNVFPLPGCEDKYGNDNPEVDHYACLKMAQGTPWGDVAVGFNGHMCKRVVSNLATMAPFQALDLTLMDFQGAPHDARIAGISGSNLDFILGVNDQDNRRKQIEAVEPQEEVLQFIYDANTRIHSEHELQTGVSTAEELAEYLHTNMFDGNLEYACGTGVMMLNGDVGVFNHLDIDKLHSTWDPKYGLKCVDGQRKKI